MEHDSTWDPGPTLINLEIFKENSLPLVTESKYSAAHMKYMLHVVQYSHPITK